MFTSLENLVLHNKCVLRQETIKMEATPKTPITDKPSPEVTPFYKIISEKVGATMGATSTPLVHKQEDDKITPINQSEIIAKSSLKLAGSSNLSDSKKSDRKVTFSETPSVSEFKKAKYLPLPKQIKDQEEEISTDLDETRDQEVFKDLSSKYCLSNTSWRVSQCCQLFSLNIKIPIHLEENPFLSLKIPLGVFVGRYMMFNWAVGPEKWKEICSLRILRLTF